MADGLKKVVFYGSKKSRQDPEFIGTETECLEWIKAHARHGMMYMAEINAYYVGYDLKYQIVAADGNE